LSGSTWSTRKIVQWFAQTFGLTASRSALRRLLHRLRLSYRQVKKLLAKADPKARTDYMKRFGTLWRAMQRGEKTLVYIDEAHFHRDLELGWTWGPKGQRTWGQSWGAKLSDRINWYGAYDFETGRCLISNLGKNTAEHSADFLEQVHAWLGPDRAKRAVMIWDNAPVHVAKLTQAKAQALGLTLQPLPGYSPDLNPIEGLWKWMREEVMHNQYHASLEALAEACQAFIERINQTPQTVLDRLWPRFELDPTEERLRHPKPCPQPPSIPTKPDQPPRRQARPLKSGGYKRRGV